MGSNREDRGEVEAEVQEGECTIFQSGSFIGRLWNDLSLLQVSSAEKIPFEPKHPELERAIASRVTNMIGAQAQRAPEGAALRALYRSPQWDPREDVENLLLYNIQHAPALHRLGWPLRRIVLTRGHMLMEGMPFFPDTRVQYEYSIKRFSADSQGPAKPRDEDLYTASFQLPHGLPRERFDLWKAFKTGLGMSRERGARTSLANMRLGLTCTIAVPASALPAVSVQTKALLDALWAAVFAYDGPKLDPVAQALANKVALPVEQVRALLTSHVGTIGAGEIFRVKDGRIRMSPTDEMLDFVDVCIDTGTDSTYVTLAVRQYSEPTDVPGPASNSGLVAETHHSDPVATNASSRSSEPAKPARSNAELAEMFARMADVTQLIGENAFKAIAFQRVSRVLEETGVDVVAAGKAGELPPIDGIGESSKRIIIEYAQTGKSKDYEQLIARVPTGVLEMLRIPGLGPKTAALLWKERGIESVDALEQAIGQGKLAGLKSVGEKKIASMLDGIRLLKAGMQRRGFVTVAPLVEKMLEMLRSDKRVGQAETAGSFRRRRETVGDVDLLCWVHRPEDAQPVIEEFCTQKGVEKVNASGRTKGSILVDKGFQIDLRIVPKENFGAALLYFTGSKDHNVKLRGLAQDKGMTLNEWGLYRVDQYDKAEKRPGEAPTTKPVAGVDEKSVYVALTLGYIEPELREDRGEIEAAVAHRLPRLVTSEDIHGELHCHTTASDGHASIEQMAEAAKALGYEYIAITDHSVSSVIANGLAPGRLKAHIAAIRKAQDRVKGIHILAGSEVDILIDGSLDYEDALLAELDLVIASPHVSLKQDTAKATDRLLRAIESRHVHIIGHPTGRMINQREGLPLDMSRIFARAAATKTALEINAGWPRWDLNDLNARAAANAGVMISINTDAHAIESLRDMTMGLWVARRAWLTPTQIVNCMPYVKLAAWLKAKR